MILFPIHDKARFEVTGFSDTTEVSKHVLDSVVFLNLLTHKRRVHGPEHFQDGIKTEHIIMAPRDETKLRFLTKKAPEW